jgi:hypothetical protein
MSYRKTDDDIRANLGVLSDVDKRWNEETNQLVEAGGEGSFMPDKIRMSKREYKEHLKSKGRAEHKKLKVGKGTYRGAKIQVI